MDERLFVKEKVLGSGSYGTVFRAISTSNDHVVAVKTTSSLSCAYSLLKEKNILSLFRYCPDIVKCYGSQITLENGIHIQNLILEYAPYGTLADLMRREMIFIKRQIREYTRMLLRGLSCIHSRGLVHCDLKPENILVFPSSDQSAFKVYQLKIADFGLAMTLDEKKNYDPALWRFSFRGTPFYMSPESVTLGEIGPALDIWSLGCIVLELVTGIPMQSSWEIEHSDDFLSKLVFMRAMPKIPKSVSNDCRDFLSKCFDRDHNRRWTAKMLLQHPFLAPPNCSFNI